MPNLTGPPRPWPPRPETLLLHQVEETPSTAHPPPLHPGLSCDTIRREGAGGLGRSARPKRINKWHNLHTIAIQSRRTEMMTARCRETDTKSSYLRSFLHISVSLRFCDTHDNESHFQLTGSHTFSISNIPSYQDEQLPIKKKKNKTASLFSGVNYISHNPLRSP